MGLDPAPAPRLFIVSGPGGVGKGTIVNALVERDPRLWLSRSWTTREQRPGESDGARQVKALHPEAVLIFVLPPSRAEQERRLRGRGDAEVKVSQRLQKALDEEPVGMAIANHVVVNDDLERTVQEMGEIIDHHRMAG